jgi:RHH-type proline utilization regulon transcriptional repressor/proline dehydrogenase/delta 1-pyrroline-5-carboxylate dehydrogenase
MWLFPAQENDAFLFWVIGVFPYTHTMKKTTDKTDYFDPKLLKISKQAFIDEPACIEHLLPEMGLFTKKADDIKSRAERYVKSIRENSVDSGIEGFMQQYGLGTNEGITIMCLAESLLRIPDKGTANELISDRLKAADWEQHLGKSSSLFVNASTWGMMLTGKVTMLGNLPKDSAGSALGKLVSKLGEPIIRESLKQAMKIISTQFVIGQDISEALI